ncbi:hypothetical protein Pst134EA_017239 [Puccinia striiformis f. sp. tritici]|uniref:hypothetical protein n=1 Tax=Puccinia striiformis f. sp. tritici TaxID=168172 RepID=UPI0020077754|nr:hypothetical protein Pst134EA_017239 [Puccinia striiformis f. sp. tritici]KAH9460927.1 hypothetical protein Pst134EA_017239 [Puccinia striiformis f. sp. tritici]
MPSHRRRNSLPTSYRVPITQPSFKPTVLFDDEKSATQYSKKIVRHVKLGGGIITLAQLGRLRIQFEEITHFLISNGFSTHPDEFTVYFWNCLSPQLKSAICYSFPDNPKETPGRIYITSPENQQSNQNDSTHSPMEERETEDQSPVIDFVDSVSLNISSSEPLTPVDITNEKAEPEGDISQNFSEKPESVLVLVEENQSFNINSVEHLPEESITTEDSSFKVDHPYFPECHSQSEWAFQSILSKTSSLDLLEAIHPLDFMSEEPFLTNSKHQDYISPSLIPSSPAITNTLEISTIQSLDEENNVQKDPGKNLEPIIKSNSISQQESLCDPIHLSKFEIKKKDLQLTITPGRSLNSLKPLWKFLSGCLVLLLSISGTVCYFVVDHAGLEGISIGSGGEKNQNDWLSKIFSSIAWKEELGLVPMIRIKDRRSTCSHQCEIIWCFYLFATLGWLGWARMRIGTRDKQDKGYRCGTWKRAKIKKFLVLIYSLTDSGKYNTRNGIYGQFYPM